MMMNKTVVTNLGVYLFENSKQKMQIKTLTIQTISDYGPAVKMQARMNYRTIRATVRDAIHIWCGVVALEWFSVSVKSLKRLLFQQHDIKLLRKALIAFFKRNGRFRF